MEAALHPTRALRRGWAILARSPVVLWLAALAVVSCERVADFLRDNLSRDFWLDLAEPYPFVTAGIPTWAMEVHVRLWAPGVVPLLLALLLVRSGAEAGAIRVHRQVILQGRSGPGALLEGARCAMRLFGFHMVGWGLILGSLSLACLPGAGIVFLGVRTGAPEMAGLGLATMVGLAGPVWLWVSLGLFLGSRAVVLEDLGPFAALERSFSLASGERAALLVFRLVCVTFKLLGIFLGLAGCIVGAMVTWPLFRAVSDAALSEAYMTGVRGRGSKWRLLLELGEE
jgi:hypothetical protein